MSTMKDFRRVADDVRGATDAPAFLTGRSMIDNVAMARQLGYLNAPDGVIVGVEEMRNTPSAKLVVVTTGSQGEPTSALTRMANGDHRHITIAKGDTVVLSASPIPEPGSASLLGLGLALLARGRRRPAARRRGR